MLTTPTLDLRSSDSIQLQKPLSHTVRKEDKHSGLPRSSPQTVFQAVEPVHLTLSKMASCHNTWTTMRD